MSAQLQFGFFDEDTVEAPVETTFKVVPAPLPEETPDHKEAPPEPQREFRRDFLLQVDKKVLPSVSMEQQLNEAMSWNDSEIMLFCERMITKSIEQVADEHFAMKYREEVLQWFLEENADAPLSFETCCIICGYDVDELREKILRRWERQDFYLSAEELRQWNARHADF